jgi:hypothetical protein
MKKVCWRFDLRVGLAVFAVVRTLFWVGLMAAGIAFAENKAYKDEKAEEAYDDKDTVGKVLAASLASRSQCHIEYRIKLRHLICDTLLG